MNIILTDKANITPFIIPVVPTDIALGATGDNEETDTIQGKISIVKNPHLRSASWSSFFPVNKNYSFVRPGSLSNGWAYVAFIELMRTLKLPIRIIVTNSDRIPILNILATIKKFNISSVDKVGDIYYEIELKETPELIYQFAIRDKEYYNRAKKYLKDFKESNDKKDRLVKAGLYLAKQEYK